MQVQLTAAQVMDAHSLAQQSLDAWGGRPGHYPNTLNSHFKGKLAEIAVETWLKGYGLAVDSIFRDMSRLGEADIAIGRRLEVKGWDKPGWTAWGRCVTPGQLPKIARKADAVVWCIIDLDDPSHALVTLAGWSTVDDVASEPVTTTGPPRNRIKNHQVPEAAMRQINALLA